MCRSLASWYICHVGQQRTCRHGSLKDAPSNTITHPQTDPHTPHSPGCMPYTEASRLSRLARESGWAAGAACCTRSGGGRPEAGFEGIQSKGMRRRALMACQSKGQSRRFANPALPHHSPTTHLRRIHRHQACGSCLRGGLTRGRHLILALTDAQLAQCGARLPARLSTKANQGGAAQGQL